jgi:hypothetical protein
MTRDVGDPGDSSRLSPLSPPWPWYELITINKDFRRFIACDITMGRSSSTCTSFALPASSQKLAPSSPKKYERRPSDEARCADVCTMRQPGRKSKREQVQGANLYLCSSRGVARPCDERLRRLVAVGARVAILAALLFCSLTRQGLLHATLLSRLQVVRMPLYFLDDVFRLDLAFEPAERVFQRLALL